MYYFSFETEVGEVFFLWAFESHKARLKRIFLSSDLLALEKTKKLTSKYVFKENKDLVEASTKIQLYLKGAKVKLPLELIKWDDLTGFQRKVLRLQLEIPRGRVASYTWLAEKIGAKGAFRAVGKALAENPYPLFIPCHRTVRKNGEVGGFTGGRELKKFLLELEGVKFSSNSRVKPEFFVK